MDIQDYIFDKEIKLYCKKADSFPAGIKPAFKHVHSLVDPIPFRKQFGISRRNQQGNLDYWAGNTELLNGEFKGKGLEVLYIPEGNYKYISIRGYMDDISQIEKAFTTLLDEVDTEQAPLGVEYYINEEEVWCMVKEKGE